MKHIVDIYDTSDRYLNIKLDELKKKEITLDEIYIKKMDIYLGIYEIWNHIIEMFNYTKIMKINGKYFLVEKDEHTSKIEIYIKSFGKGNFMLEDAQYNHMIGNLPSTLEQLIIYVDNSCDGDKCSSINLQDYCLMNLGNSLKSIKIKTFYDSDGNVLNITIGNVKLPHECKFILDMTPIEPSKKILLHNFENIEDLLIETRCDIKMVVNKEEISIAKEKYSSNKFYNF